jgi:hypothetical protein
MPWPAFNALGDLPAGVYRATLADVIAHFGHGTAQRVAITTRLEPIYALAHRTGFLHCVLRAFPDDPKRMPPSMHYFMKINEILRGMTKEALSDKSILIGPVAAIIETLKRVERDGIEEVILDFNVGRKPHALVKEQMHRFMEEVAPAFEGSPRRQW